MYYHYNLELICDKDNRCKFKLDAEEFDRARKALSRLGVERESSTTYRLRNREEYFKAIEAVARAVNSIPR